MSETYFEFRLLTGNILFLLTISVGGGFEPRFSQ